MVQKDKKSNNHLLKIKILKRIQFKVKIYHSMQTTIIDIIRRHKDQNIHPTKIIFNKKINMFKNNM